MCKPTGCGGCPAIGASERLLLWSARQVAAMGLCCPAVDASFHESYGADGIAIGMQFKSMLALIGATATRPISVGVPGRRCVTRDELGLLAIVDAAGCGDFDLAHRLLGGFVRADRVDAVAHAAEQVAEALAAAGAKLNARHLIPG